MGQYFQTPIKVLMLLYPNLVKGTISQYCGLLKGTTQGGLATMFNWTMLLPCSIRTPHITPRMRDEGIIPNCPNMILWDNFNKQGHVVHISKHKLNLDLWNVDILHVIGSYPCFKKTPWDEGHQSSVQKRTQTEFFWKGHVLKYRSQWLHLLGSCFWMLLQGQPMYFVHICIC